MSYEDAMDATIARDEAHARAIAAAEERGRLRGLAEALEACGEPTGLDRAHAVRLEICARLRALAATGKP